MRNGTCTTYNFVCGTTAICECFRRSHGPSWIPQCVVTSCQGLIDLSSSRWTGCVIRVSGSMNWHERSYLGTTRKLATEYTEHSKRRIPHIKEKDSEIKNFGFILLTIFSTRISWGVVTQNCAIYTLTLITILFVKQIHMEEIKALQDHLFTYCNYWISHKYLWYFLFGFPGH